eukprot:m.31986 g.31986  ORF g.31986 m.31986 type:complete len:66 (-) comp5439_c0_seq1:601-798(-)
MTVWPAVALSSPTETRWVPFDLLSLLKRQPPNLAPAICTLCTLLATDLSAAAHSELADVLCRARG